MKKLIAMLFSVLLLFTSCGFSSGTKGAKALEGMKNHLSERYGGFDYVSGPVAMRELTRPDTDECYMHVQQGDTEEEQDKFIVIRSGNVDEGFTFADNYYWYLVRDEYEAQMQAELDAMFPGCKVFLALGWGAQVLPDEISGQTTLQQAQEIGLPKHMFWVFVDPDSMAKDDFINLEHALQTRFPQKEMNITFRVFYPETHEVYTDAHRYNYVSLRRSCPVEIDNLIV